MTIEAYLQRRSAELKATAQSHQGMRYRYWMLRALEHEAALDALYFVQFVIGQNSIVNWDESLLGRLGQMERLYGERWPAIARKSASFPALLHRNGEAGALSATRSGQGEVESHAQLLADRLSAQPLHPTERLRLASGVAALDYLRSVLAMSSQRTIIAALLELERTLLAW